MGVRKTNEQFLKELAIKNPNVLPLEPYVEGEEKRFCVDV